MMEWEVKGREDKCSLDWCNVRRCAVTDGKSLFDTKPRMH